MTSSPSMILSGIVDKISRFTGRQYTTSRGYYLKFDNPEQIQIVYIALKELAPQLRKRDTNEDRNHSKRIDYEKHRVEHKAEFFSTDDTHKEILLESMIKTHSQALDSYIRYIKSLCIYVGYSKKQIENIAPLLRDGMVLVAERKISLDQDLFELNKAIDEMINNDTCNDYYLSENGVVCITNLPNEGWL